MLPKERQSRAVAKGTKTKHVPIPPNLVQAKVGFDSPPIGIHTSKMDNVEIDKKAAELVTKAEHAFDSAEAEREAYNSITTELNQLTPKDRTAVADEMMILNLEHRLKDDSLPRLELDENHTGPAEYEVSGIHMARPRGFWDLGWVFGDIFERKDVYNIRPEKW